MPNTDNCVIVTSAFAIHSHTFDASKFYVIDADAVNNLETQIKQKLQEMSLKTVNTYNKRFERSVIVEVLKQNARFTVTCN